MSDWQTIETAPKDGMILAWEDGRCWIATWQSAEYRWLEVGSLDSLTLRPTHWMPLPDPPHASDEATRPLTGVPA